MLPRTFLWHLMTTSLLSTWRRVYTGAQLVDWWSQTFFHSGSCDRHGVSIVVAHSRIASWRDVGRTTVFLLFGRGVRVSFPFQAKSAKLLRSRHGENSNIMIAIKTALGTTIEPNQKQAIAHDEWRTLLENAPIWSSHLCVDGLSVYEVAQHNCVPTNNQDDTWNKVLPKNQASQTTCSLEISYMHRPICDSSSTLRLATL